MQTDSCLQHDVELTMESIPESPSGSPIFYRGVSHLEIPIRLTKRNRSYSGLDDLSNPSLTSSIQCHEARVLRLCNKKYPSLQLGDNTISYAAEYGLPDRFLTRTRDQFRSPTDDITLGRKPDKAVDCDWSEINKVHDDVEKEEDIKRAINWTRRQLISIREDDRKLLRQFIEIRFKIESLGCQLQRWNCAVSLASYRDLRSLATLPRSQATDVEEYCPQFRQRALSLRTPKIEHSPVILRHRKD